MIVSTPGWLLPSHLVEEYGKRLVPVLRDAVKAHHDGFIPLEVADVLAELEREAIRLRDRRLARLTAERLPVLSADRGQSDCRPETMTVKEVVRVTGKKERNIRDLCERGTLRADKPDGWTWQIDADSVARYMEGRSDDGARAS